MSGFVSLVGAGPGVSAALAAPAAAGIPDTHRGLAHTFTVSTGTGEGGPDLSNAELRALALGGGPVKSARKSAPAVRSAAWRSRRAIGRSTQIFAW